MDGLKSWGVLAVVVILGVLCSGCVGTTEAASSVREGAQGNASAQAGDTPALFSQAAAQGNARLHFVPSPQQVEVGGVASVQLRLEDVDNLYGIEVHLIFDANLVQVEDDDPGQAGVQITPGEIPYPEFGVQNAVDNLGGRLDYAIVQLAPRPAASGSGVVATIHFQGVREGTSPIRFTGVKLASPEGYEIPVTPQEGFIVVVSAPPQPTTPAPTTPPTTPPPATPQPTTPPPAASPTQPPAPTPGAAPFAPSACPALYVVRTNDTAFSIARRFGISLDALVAANNLSSSAAIKIGQLLVLPGVPGPTATVHVVQAGDTLYSIARRYGTSVETIAALNQIPHPWHAPLGRTLLLCTP